MIEYSIRKSQRTRRVRLSVTSNYGVVIVVPQYFDVAKIPKIISEKDQWIRRAVEKVGRGNIIPIEPISVPEKIVFECNNSKYSVIVRHHSHRKNILTFHDNVITLSVNTNNPKIIFLLLKKWLQSKAKEILTPWIRKVSVEHGIPFNKVVVRSQRTRWGSCSTKKNINLNRSIVFIPPHLVEYLFIHELCHTIEMNHSKRYWQLVETHCPNYKMFDKELKKISKTIERWVI